MLVGGVSRGSNRRVSVLPSPVDELPELGEFLEGFVLGHGELGAEEEILERVLVEDAVDEEGPASMRSK